MVPAVITDPVLGKLAQDGDSRFIGFLEHQRQRIEIVLPGTDDSSIDLEALLTARRIAQELPSVLDQALTFLATFHGFGGLGRVRAIFAFRGIVCTSKQGRFWFQLNCSEDRDPDAIWRVEFEDWTPHAQGRDD
jgi:hypothetical protein